MSWNKIISDESMRIVSEYETSQGRLPKEVHKSGVGYDILSKDSLGERYIEVKASSELWSSYNWLSLYHNEVKTLNKYPNNFFIYIVKFELDLNNRTADSLKSAKHEMYIINGKDLLKEFRILPETYSLTPISKRKLAVYKI